MRLPRHIALSLLATTFGLGCGGVGLGIDGGPVGTGITASVVGNVVAVEDPTTTGAPDDLASLASTTSTDGALAPPASVGGIEVELVEFPEINTTTDGDGNFSLDGAFAGAVTLRFRTRDLEAEQPLDVPSGGVVVLSDIQLEQDGITAEAGRQLAAEGEVREIDCDAGRLEIQGRRQERIRVTLIEETEFVRDGAAASCQDVRRRDEVSVEGLLDDIRGSDVTALVVTLSPDASAPPPIERRVAFLGNIVSIDCAERRLSLHDGTHLVRLRLLEGTILRSREGGNVSCDDLDLGDRMSGAGILNLRQPGLARAQLLVRSARGGPGAALPISGVVAATECDQRLLLVLLNRAVVTVRITAGTRVEPPQVSCEDIVVDRTRVKGRGVVSPDIPGALDARRLKFTRIQRDDRR